MLEMKSAGGVLMKSVVAGGLLQGRSAAKIFKIVLDIKNNVVFYFTD